ncbi:MAG: lipoate--protein ligase family protein [Caldilineaceae bacterium]|nr:lipoate--protein ligase family protein [Caldilineaceae bacterium]MCB0141124.1 lipoate--protein ligase family protein [Caldilineaceae bacterium]
MPINLVTPFLTFEPADWRLIIEDAPRSGSANMAVDHAIAEACAAGESLPTLRFYRWQPPAISLGRHQPLAEIDLEAAAAHGYDIVRRTTGGRAILHVDELTYSVAAPKSEPRVEGGVMDAYLRLSNALVTGLHLLGVPADKAGGDTKVSKDVSAACFEVPSAYEITVGGRKLMGSAQSRRAGYVLQHGSLPLFGDITRLIPVLSLPGPQRDLLTMQLAQRACTLNEALGGNEADIIGFEQAACTLKQGFEQVLNLQFKPGQLTPQEARRTAELLREQYANPEWTQVR